MADLHVDSIVEDEVTRLQVAGDLDVAAAEPLDEAIDAAFGDGARSLVVDLTETTFVDSTGLSHLLRARRRADAEHAKLRIVAPPGSEARVVIDLTGVGSLLGVDEPPAA
jgi:anti-sigma B factor antagonist